MKRLKAVFFDLDDTLLNDTKATYRYRKIFYDNHRDRLGTDFDSFYEEWERSITDSLEALARGSLDLDTSRKDRMRLLFREPGMPDSEAQSYVTEYLLLYEESWELFPDSLPLIDILSPRLPLGIITNGIHSQQFDKLTRFGLQDRFQAFISADVVGAVKPQKMIFEHAAAALGTTCQECLFIGDGYERDALGSLAAGMMPLWLVRKPIPSITPAPGITLITSLSEVPGLLHSWNI